MRLPLQSVLTLVFCLGTLPTLLAQFSQDTYFLSVNTCTDLAELCSEYDAAAYAAHEFRLDGQEITSPFSACTSGGAAFEIGVGAHVIEALLNGAVVDDAAIDVQCTATSTYEYHALYIPTAITVCPDLSALSGPVASFSTASPAEHVSIDLAANDCFEITPTSVGVERVDLTYCDGAGTCATAFYEFDVELANTITSTTFNDTIAAPGGVVTYCINTLELPGTVSTIANACPEASGQYVGFALDASTYCVKYRGLTAGGTDTACVVICDDLGFCDTTTIIVTTGNPTSLPERDLDFVIEEGVSQSVILDTSDLPGAVASVTNDCPDESGTFVAYTFEAVPASVNFAGLLVGTEIACVDVTDVDGVVQRFNVQVTVIPRRASNDTIRMRQGTERLWCFRDYDLPTPAIEIFDDCVAADEKVELSFPDDVECVSILAEELGGQALCMTVCDGNGECDTRELYVIVLPNDDDRLPTAFDDFYVVPTGGPATVDPLRNDDSDSPFTFARIVSGPALGTARFTADFELVYELTEPCDTDELVYEVCNQHGCDQATVTLANDCDGTQAIPDVIVRKGFSPNGDGDNDTWQIDNIEFYERSEVVVFNRWGTEVYRVSRYANDWDGTFEDQLLPDGTYFYVATLDEREPIAGYVHIRR